MGGGAASVPATPTNLEAYAPALRSYFRKRVKPEDVEDLVQEVLLRMQGRQGAPILNAQGYIFSVAANILKKEYLHSARRGTEVDIGIVETADPLTPERIASAREEVDLIWKALDSLPPRTRDIFVAHRFEDMSYGAIARNLGISVSAVEKHIMSALRYITIALERLS